MTTPTQTETWKQVPLDFTFGETILASNLGNIIHNDKQINGYKSSHGKDGHYRIYTINKHTLYFHRLVFYAHSTLPINTLKQGRVIFKNKDGIVNDDGFYRNWYEDLLFEQSRTDFLSLLNTVEIKTDTHPIYGTFTYGKWTPLYIPSVDSSNNYIEVDTYELVLLDNNSYPALIRNINTGKIVKYHFNNMHDGYVNITHNKAHHNYQLSHVMLLTTFPEIDRNHTVDHIDNNPLNHNIKNMQWLSHSENAIKGAKITTTKPKQIKTIKYLPGEEWRPLQITEHTSKIYKVSNLGRIQNSFHITLGHRLRGKKYRYILIAVSSGKYKKYYIHQLVYMTFHGEIPDGTIILHDDTVPLHTDGTYRNWAVDLRAGSKRDNNIEYHNEKRNVLIINDIQDDEPPENTVITPLDDLQNISSMEESVNIGFWTTSQIYNAYINNSILTYKTWCEQTQGVSGSTWNTIWDGFITTLNSSTDESTNIAIINKFINKLAKHRRYKKDNTSITLHPSRGKWNVNTILRAWQDGDLCEFKTYQENYTGDSPTCPKWKDRWESFVESLRNASNDTECKSAISKFTGCQHRRASRLRLSNPKVTPNTEKTMSKSLQQTEVNAVPKVTPMPSPQLTPVVNVIVPTSSVTVTLTQPVSATNTIVNPEKAPRQKQWKVKQIYDHFQANKLDEYKAWCEMKNNLSGPEWDIQWYTFILELQRAPNRLMAENIIRAFVEDLKKKRHDLLVQERNHEVNPLDRETRQQWPSISVLRAWKEDKLNLFKEFQEKYTGDSPECPKWQARWTRFTEAIQTAPNDEEKKTVISKFMTAQRTRVYRQKCENK